MGRDLKGRRVIITGGSSGIGAAAAKGFRNLGAEVTITGRSTETERVAAAIGAEAVHVNLTDLADVKKFAEHALARYPTIDILVNNVGGIFQARSLTKDGHETTFQVNHLAGFYLTNLLRPRLESSNAVVINTSSVAHKFGRVDLANLENEGKYSPMQAYGRAKLMNILHAKEISKRFAGVKSASFHPGPVATGFAREGGFFIKLIYETPLKDLFLITPEKGAETLLWLGSTEAGKDWKSGGYFAKKKPGSMNSQANDDELARKLWDACLEKLL